MLEEMLIAYCSPTLADLKTGNLFSYSPGCEECLAEEIAIWNYFLNPRDVYLELFNRSEGKVLIYVYRKNRLLRDLLRPEASRFLESLGYNVQELICSRKALASVFSLLKSRLITDNGFPHEIGLFLSYPLEDVLGFIINNGRDYKLCGYWKVYGNEKQAERIFNAYSTCRRVYLSLFYGGKSIQQLIH